MIMPDDPAAIEDAWDAALKLPIVQEIALTDQIASLAQALGFVLEVARNRGLTEGVSSEELDELVERYKRRGAILQRAIAQHEGKKNGN